MPALHSSPRSELIAWLVIGAIAPATPLAPLAMLLWMGPVLATGSWLPAAMLLFAFAVATLRVRGTSRVGVVRSWAVAGWILGFGLAFDLLVEVSATIAEERIEDPTSALLVVTGLGWGLSACAVVLSAACAWASITIGRHWLLRSPRAAGLPPEESRA